MPTNPIQNTKQPMQHPNPYGASNPNGPAPSVPLTVYRELAAELQATQAMLDSLHAQNQQLTRDNQSLSEQNQQLQVEVEKVVQSALHMKQVADTRLGGTSEATSAFPHGETIGESQPSFDTLTPKSKNSRSPRKPSMGGRDKIAELPPLYPNSPQPTPAKGSSSAGFFPGGEFPGFGEELSDKGGAWLLVAIIAIVVVAFGGGYAFMRPIYERQMQQTQPQQFRPPNN